MGLGQPPNILQPRGGAFVGLASRRALQSKPYKALLLGFNFFADTPNPYLNDQNVVVFGVKITFYGGNKKMGGKKKTGVHFFFWGVGVGVVMKIIKKWFLL